MGPTDSKPSARVSPITGAVDDDRGYPRRVPFPEISVDVSEDVALLVDQLGPERSRRIVTAALRDRASEELRYDVADELLEDCELTDEEVRALAADLEERVAERHGRGRRS